MCHYIKNDYVMPGYICCRCKSYNGLQRQTLLAGQTLTTCWRKCPPRCTLIVSDPTIEQCASCLAGFEIDERKRLIENLAGDTAKPDTCFICKRPWKALSNAKE